MTKPDTKTDALLDDLLQGVNLLKRFLANMEY